MANSLLGLRTLVYSVTDIEAAKEWYKKVLGIEPYFDEPFYVGFNVAGYELGLAQSESINPSTGNASTYWGVENVKEEYERLISLGAKPHEEPSDVGGDIVVAAVTDPWGNIFGMIYNPHFKLP